MYCFFNKIYEFLQESYKFGIFCTDIKHNVILTSLFVSYKFTKYCDLMELDSTTFSVLIFADIIIIISFIASI